MFNLRQSQSLSLAHTMLAIATALALLVLGAAQAQRQPPPPSRMPLPKADPPGKADRYAGPGENGDGRPHSVRRPKAGHESAQDPVGKSRAQDGTQFTVPVASNFATAPKLPDLYNECSGGSAKACDRAA